MIRWFLLKKYSIRSVINVDYETVEHVHPVTKQSTGGPLFIISTGGAHLYYFNGWRPGPFFIISTGGASSSLFQKVGPRLYYFNGRAPFLFFQRGRPLLYHFNGWGLFHYFNGCMGPLLYYFNGWGPLILSISRVALSPAHLCSPFVAKLLIVLNLSLKL